MPTLTEFDGKVISKSVLRHRPIGVAPSSVAQKGEPTVGQPPVAQRASRLPVADEVTEWERTTGPVAAVRTQSTQRTRRTTTNSPGGARTTRTISKLPSSTMRVKLTLARQQRAMRAHPLFFLGLGMLTMLTLWVALNVLVDWVGVTRDDLQYGRPRTFQTDAWVGHNEQTGIPSHFLALNLHRHIEIIEIAGGDAAHTRIYSGPQLYGANDGLVPVTLTFLDVNGDHELDMLVNFQGTRIVSINDRGDFRPLQPAERPKVEYFLEHLGH